MATAFIPQNEAAFFPALMETMMELVVQSFRPDVLPLIWHLTKYKVFDLEARYLTARSRVIDQDEHDQTKSNEWIDNRCFEFGQRFAAGNPEERHWLFIYKSKHGHLGKTKYRNESKIEATWTGENIQKMIVAAREPDDANAVSLLCTIPMIGPGTASWFRCATSGGACPVIDIHASTALAGWRETPDNDKGIVSFISQMKWHAARLDVTVRALDRAVFAAGSRFLQAGVR